jgi:hypothetical protein
MTTTLPVRIIGTSLPGRVSGEHDALSLGVQRGKAVEQLVPADVERAVFETQVELRTGARGLDFAGPYVHGKPGERFLYLTWGVGDESAFTMVGRVKLHLPVAVGDDDLADAAAAGKRLEGSLGLTGPTGKPVVASVRPPAITWRVTAA